MATGPVLTYSQIQSLWVQNGGSPGWAPLAAAIAIAESGGNTVALDNNPKTGDYSVGLWQINYFGDLLNSRTAEFGNPATLQADPDAQAAAAVKLSGNGSNWGPWKNDAAWKVWQNNGAPPQPRAQQLANWGAPTSSAGSGTSSDATANESSSPSGGTGCGSQPPIFSVIGLSFSRCQAKALVGGMAVGFGGGVALAGVLIIVAWGLGNTSAGKGAAKAVRALPGGKRAPKPRPRPEPGSGAAPVSEEDAERKAEWQRQNLGRQQERERAEEARRARNDRLAAAANF